MMPSPFMVGGASSVAEGLRGLDQIPTPDQDPSFYSDYDETGPFVAAVGDSECAV